MAAEPLTSLPPRFRRNVLSSYVSTGFISLVGLVVTPLLARSLGPERYGIWALIGSMVVYVDLLQFGFVGAATRDVAEAEAVGDRDRLQRAVATAFWVMCLPAVVALALAAGFAVVAPALFHIGHAYVLDTRVLTGLIGVAMAIALPAQPIMGVLIGLQRYDLLYATEIGYWGLVGVAWSAIAVSGGGLIWLGAAALILGFALMLVRLSIARRLVKGLSLAPRFFDRSLIGRFSRLSGWLALADVADVVLYRIDTFVVGAVASVPAVGIYTVGQKLASTADKGIRPMGTGIFPFAAGLAGRSDSQRLRHAVLTGTRLSLAVAVPLSVALALLARPLLHVWVGEAFVGGRDVVIYLALTTIVMALSRPGTLALQGAGRPRVPALLGVTEALLNLGLSVGFGLWIGFTGVALGTLVAAATFRVAVFIPYMCHQFGIPIHSFAASTLRAHVPPTTTSLLLGWLVLQLDLPDLETVFLAGPLMVSAYALVFVLTGLDAVDRQRLLSKLKARRGEPIAAPMITE